MTKYLVLVTTYADSTMSKANKLIYYVYADSKDNAKLAVERYVSLSMQRFVYMYDIDFCIAEADIPHVIQ